MTSERRAELRSLAEAAVFPETTPGREFTEAARNEFVALLDALDAAEMEKEISDNLLRQADNAAHDLAKVLGRTYDRQTNFGESVTDLREMVAEVAKLAWVSVAERLPEPYRYVLVFSEREASPYSRYWLSAILANGEWDNMERPQRFSPTHWMPLPPGPAGKGTT